MFSSDIQSYASQFKNNALIKDAKPDDVITVEEYNRLVKAVYNMMMHISESAR